MSVSWTQEHKDYLTSLWAGGYTSAQCSNGLWDQFHVRFSRSAVAGQIKRLGLPRRRMEGKAYDGVRPKRPKQAPRVRDEFDRLEPGIVELPQLPEVVCVPVGVDIISVENSQCRYPISREGEPFLCCGLPTDSGSWCVHHRPIVFTKPERRERQRVSVYSLRGRTEFL